MFTALSKSYAPFGNGTLELETPLTADAHKIAKMRDEKYAKNNDDDDDEERMNGFRCSDDGLEECLEVLLSCLRLAAIEDAP
jgi:hypothetical protein